VENRIGHGRPFSSVRLQQKFRDDKNDVILSAAKDLIARNPKARSHPAAMRSCAAPRTTGCNLIDCQRTTIDKVADSEPGEGSCLFVLKSGFPAACAA
jgi:hypothetical protein